MPANRCVVHVSKIEEFKEWLRSRGYNIEDPKGFYEVVRARKPGRAPVIFHKRDRTDHLTCMYGEPAKLGAMFVAESRRARASEKA
jgi:hypothetical protein